MKKLSLLLIFLFSGIYGFGQKLEPAVYGKVNGFRHTGFEDNGFADFGLGFSLLSNYWISPKIGFKFATGSPSDNVSFLENDGQKLVRTNYNGNFLTLGAKIRLTKPEEVWLFIWPEYSLGNVTFKSSYFKTENNPAALQLQERTSLSEFYSYLDLAAGIELYMDSNQRFLASVYLVYTLMDIKSGFDQLSFENTSVRSPSEMNSTIGLGLSIEYCFRKKP